MTAKRVKVSWWSRLQPRERKMLMLLGVVALTMTATVMFVLRHQKSSALEEEISTQRRALELAYTMGPRYGQLKNDKKKKAQAIATTPLSFTSLMEEAQGKAEIKVTNQEEDPPVDEGDGLRRRVFKFSMRDVSLEQLMKFMVAIESKPGHAIASQRLEVRSLGANKDPAEDILKAEVEIVTWERMGAAPEEKEG
jgi:hypothetical protein